MLYFALKRLSAPRGKHAPRVGYTITGCRHCSVTHKPLKLSPHGVDAEHPCVIPVVIGVETAMPDRDA